MLNVTDVEDELQKIAQAREDDYLSTARAIAAGKAIAATDVAETLEAAGKTLTDLSASIDVAARRLAARAILAATPAQITQTAAASKAADAEAEATLAKHLEVRSKATTISQKLQSLNSRKDDAVKLLISSCPSPRLVREYRAAESAHLAAMHAYQGAVNDVCKYRDWEKHLMTSVDFAIPAMNDAMQNAMQNKDATKKQKALFEAAVIARDKAEAELARTSPLLEAALAALMAA